MEWTAAVGLTATAVAVHLAFFRSAGPLWRDEAMSLTESTFPRLADVLANPHNSFPIGWRCGLRLWVDLGLGRTDQAVRGFGLLAGLAVVAALWHNARRLGAATPVVSLALLQFTCLTVCVGDQIRGYGWGMCLGVLTIGRLWRAAQAPTPARLAVAGLVAVLAVQVLMFNAVLVLAGCAAAAAVCLAGRRGWRPALSVLGVGGLAAVSMLDCLPMVRGRAPYAFLIGRPPTVTQILGALPQVTRGMPQGTWSPLRVDLAWAAALAVGLAAVGARAVTRAVARAVARTARPSAPVLPDAAAFSAVTLAIGGVVYLGFLVALRYPPAPRYYLAGLAMAATCADALVAALPGVGTRAVVAAAAGWLGYANFTPCWQSARTCMTNVDCVADHLATVAGPDDLVLVHPFWLNLSFARYYHGRAPWATVPPAARARYLRYDLMLAATRDPHAIDPLLARLSATLAGGHRVWVVSINGTGLTVAPPPSGPPLPPPSPGSLDTDWYLYWGDAIRRLISARATLSGPRTPRVTRDVNEYELVTYFEADGRPLGPSASEHAGGNGFQH